MTVKVDFKYTAEDFEEAAAAKAAALVGPKSAPAKATTMAKFGIGWILFAGLAAVFVPMLNGRHGARRSHPQADEPIPTHNFLQTLAVSSAAPLLLTALLGLVASKSTGTEPVPYHSAKGPAKLLAHTFWKIAGVICLVVAIGAWIAVFNLSTAPDWRPKPMPLFLVMIGPWLVWLFLLFGLVRAQQARSKKHSGHDLFAMEGGSISQPQRMEAGDDGIVISNSLMSLRFSWSYVVSYVEAENVMTFYTRDLSMQVIPRRAFTEPGSFERFCGLLQTHVPAGLFLPRQSAFSVITPVPVLPAEPDAGSNSKLTAEGAE